MKVEFGAMEETAIPGFKGGEGVTHARMFADGRNRIMRGRLEPGCSIGLHTHEGSSEIVYVLSGTGKALYGGGEERLAPGDCHYCQEGHAHSLINDGTQPLFYGRNLICRNALRVPGAAGNGFHFSQADRRRCICDYVYSCLRRARLRCLYLCLERRGMGDAGGEP